MIRTPRARIALAVAALTVVVGTRATAAEPAAMSSPAASAAADLHVFRLSNGMEVVHRRIRHNRVFALRAYIVGGRRRLTAETQGIAALWFGTAVRGSARYTRDQIDDLLESLGASVGGTQRQDLDVFSARCLTPDIAAVLDVAGDVLTAPTLDPKELEIVREQLIAAAKTRRESPDWKLANLASRTFFRGHPYSYDDQGTPDTLKSITRDQIVAFAKTALTAGQMFITVVGDVETDALKALLDKAFGTLPAGGVPPEPVPEIPPTVDQPLLTEVLESPTYYVAGRFAGLSADHPDAPVLELAMQALRNELWDEVRTKRGLTYAVSSGAQAVGRGVGSLYVTAVDPDNTVRVMLHTLQRLIDNPLPEAKVRATAAQYETDYYLARESNMELAASLGWARVYLGDPARTDAYMARIRTLTPADVQRVLKAYAKSITWAVLGPEPTPAVLPPAAFKLPPDPLPAAMDEKNFTPLPEESPHTGDMK